MVEIDFCKITYFVHISINFEFTAGFFRSIPNQFQFQFLSILINSGSSQFRPIPIPILTNSYQFQFQFQPVPTIPSQEPELELVGIGTGAPLMFSKIFRLKLRETAEIQGKQFCRTFEDFRFLWKKLACGGLSPNAVALPNLGVWV